MNSAFLDSLADLSTENAEHFRARGIVATLTPRSEGRSRNSQALNFSHANWQGSLVVWDSGETELCLVINKTGASTIREKHYDTPLQMRENLRQWLIQNMNI